MRMTRIFQALDLAVGQEITLTEEASHHLFRVLRLTINAPLIIFNGQGGEYEGFISHVDKRSVRVKLTQFFDTNVESPLHIHLGQVISRGDKMDFTLQKAVELGVNAITPLVSVRCGVKLSEERSEKKQQHWEKVMMSAAEQSGRTVLPKLHEPMELNKWLSSCEAATKVILHPHEHNAFKRLEKSLSLAVTVGPEGGFSDEEIKLAQEKGFHCLQLGPRILRTETAALAALAALQSRFGDF